MVLVSELMLMAVELMVLLGPCRALILPREVFYGTRFGSKHHIMAQLVTIYREGNTYQASLTHFWTFGAPLGPSIWGHV